MTDVVKLALLALELDTTVEAVARHLGQEVLCDGAGFRVCAASRAAELITAHERREREAAARAERRASEARARAAEQRQAGVERGQAFRESAAKGESQIKKMEISQVTEIPGMADVPPAVAVMTADAPVEYEGGTMTPRPSRLDWMTGKAEGGGSFGPPPRRRAAAEEAE